MDIASYFVTKNVRSPYMCVMNVAEWRARSNVRSTCSSGRHLLSRPMTEREIEFCDDAVRRVAIRWSSLASLVSMESFELGDEMGRKILKSAVREWSYICRFAEVRRKKIQAKDRKKEKIRKAVA